MPPASCPPSGAAADSRAIALLHVAREHLPFGGIGPCGIGAYHGREGFKRFSHARAVRRIGFINVFERLGPPWGRRPRR